MTPHSAFPTFLSLTARSTKFVLPFSFFNVLHKIYRRPENRKTDYLMGNTESIHLRNFFTLTTYKDVGRTHKLNHSRHCVVDYYGG